MSHDARQLPSQPLPARRLIALLAALAVRGASAEEPVVQPEGQPPGSSISVTVTREDGAQRVRAQVSVAVPAVDCYAVLADFDRLEEFVPGLESSEVVSGPGDDPLLLRQVGVASALFFRSTLDVTLAVRVQPPHRIEFERVAGNLRRMNGHWAVAGDARHCEIAYEADVAPDFWVPPLIGPRLLRRQVERQLEGVLGEIEGRARRDPAP